eukprot:5940288-Prymnesium_polylepis.1
MHPRPRCAGRCNACRGHGRTRMHPATSSVADGRTPARPGGGMLPLSSPPYADVAVAETGRTPPARARRAISGRSGRARGRVRLDGAGRASQQRRSSVRGREAYPGHPSPKHPCTYCNTSKAVRLNLVMLYVDYGTIRHEDGRTLPRE